MIESILIYIGIVIIALLGFWGKALSASGVLAAVAVGSAIYVGFDLKGLVLLGTFFGTSTIWSKFRKDRKKKLEEKLEKSDQRDFVQVMVNGGAAAVISLLYFITEYHLFEKLFIISLAASNSDTWASEIGTLSKGKPYLLTTFRKVERGTSGAVSMLGTLSALIGSLLIVYVAHLLSFSLTGVDIMIVTILGFMGNLIDTVLGAVIQITYSCPVCHLETERTTHCRTRTVPLKGCSLFNNDMVNGLSNVLAICLGLLWYAWV
ncbi:DUF92 domain-containing protein [Bacillus songklensis]|uniref:DUF92 domain-containing protein n=1 Tax=Bacillus songklensis TaxID=1069116 RepID=A0ABV8B108_9BACI